MSFGLTILACATCYGAADAAQTQGANMAIFTMLGVTGVVLGCFVGLIICLVRRARRYQATAGLPNELPQTG